MSDIGPRRTLDLRSPNPNAPAANRPPARPQPAPVAQPAPLQQPTPRPMAPRPPQPAPAPQVTARQQPAPTQAPVPQPAAKPARKKSGGWRVALQFIIGLLVIIGVAAAIVALYVKYYQ